MFGNGLVSSTYDSTPTTDNDYCIPYQIYGVRFSAGSGSGGGSNVIGNPTGIATETLQKISIDNTIYGIPPQTIVQANPEGGGVTELTSILIGQEKYRIAAETGLEIIRRV